MSWWLSVFFFINGVWVPGATIDGWSPRAYPTREACMEHKMFAERQTRLAPLDYHASWQCTPGAPATSVTKEYYVNTPPE